MYIYVSKQDIERAAKDWDDKGMGPANCPIANALKRRGYANPYVLLDTAVIEGVTYHLPPTAARLSLSSCDGPEADLKPIRFRITKKVKT
jgi:hypothetical protein